MEAYDFSLPIGFHIALRNAAGARLDLGMPALVEREGGTTRAVWSSWREAIREQMGVSGILSREISLSLDAAEGLARPGAPVVTYHPDLGWLALLDTDRNRVRILRAGGSAVWVEKNSAADPVAAVLREGTIDWIVLEVGLFGASARGDAGSHSSSAPKLSPLGNLMEILQPERSDIFAIVLYSGFTGLLTLAIPIAVQQLVNTVGFGGLVQPVVVLALLLLVGLAIAACLYAFQAYLAELFQQRIFVRGCLDLAHRLPRVSEGGFGSYSAPAFVNRFFDLVTVQKTGARLVLEGSGVILQTATGLLVLSFYHPLMLALSIFLFGAMAAVGYSFGRGAPASAIRESSAKYAIAAWLEELVRHPTAFRNGASRRRAESHGDTLVTSWVSARRHHYQIVFRQFVAALGLQVIVNTGVLALGGYLVVAGELTLGQLVASEIIVASVVASFARLAKHFESYYDLLAAVTKVSELFNLPLEAGPQGRDPVDSSEGGAARIACHGVSLGGVRRPLLQDVSLDVAAGERVLVVGSWCAGKSELLDVLSGLRRTDAGYVTLGDRDLRDQSAQAARDRIALIRSPQILATSLLSNLTMSSTDATLERVQEVLRSLDLLDDIRQLPQGLETVLDDRGLPLDRSQAMRLEIARALIARPDVILLDLQTADFDDRSMLCALETLLAPDAPWTLIAVSTMETIADRCDRVFDIDSGVLSERSGRLRNESKESGE